MASYLFELSYWGILGELMRHNDFVFSYCFLFMEFGEIPKEVWNGSCGERERVLMVLLI
jgi:hypothetical protein